MIRSKVIGALVLSLAALVAAPQVDAATVSFSFDQATSGWATQLAYGNAGLGLTVTGKTTNGAAAKVATWAGAGLGLCNRNEAKIGCPPLLDQHGIDSLGPLDDVAVLTFSRAVTLKKLVFNDLGNTNSFDLYLGGDTWTQALDDAPTSADWTPGEAFTALAFGVGAGQTTIKQCVMLKKKSVCHDVKIDASFKLRSIEVEPAAVPVPAAGWLMLAGLASIAAARRRKRA